MPPDVWGRGGIGLDYTGQPIVFHMGETGETVGDPYELVLNRKLGWLHRRTVHDRGTGTDLAL